MLLLGVQQIPKISAMTQKPTFVFCHQQNFFSNTVHVLQIICTAAQYEGDKYN